MAEPVFCSCGRCLQEGRVFLVEKQIMREKKLLNRARFLGTMGSRTWSHAPAERTACLSLRRQKEDVVEGALRAQCSQGFRFLKRSWRFRSSCEISSFLNGGFFPLPPSLHFSFPSFRKWVGRDRMRTELIQCLRGQFVRLDLYGDAGASQSSVSGTWETGFCTVEG